MGNIVIPNTFSDSPPATNLIKAAEVNANFTAVTGQVNGNLDNSNIKAGADIDGAKLLAAGTPLSRLVPLILYGSVNGATGAILVAGSGGWSSVRNSAGSYTITFSPVFSATPVIAGLAAVNAGLPILPWSSSHGVSSLVVLTNRTSTDAATDCSFGFVAIGPR